MNLQSCKFYGILSITVPATPLLCMRTEAGQLLVEMVYNKDFGDYVSGQGYCTAVAYSAEEAIEIIDDYLSL